MNPGPVEEGAKVAGGVVEALKNQPVILALVLFNLVFLGVFYAATRDQRSRQDHFQEKLFEQQAETMKMLYTCVPAATPPTL